MSSTTTTKELTLLCLVEGDREVFDVVAAPDCDITAFKRLVFKECNHTVPPNFNLNAKDLTLRKVDVDLKGMSVENVANLHVEGKRLVNWDHISEYWPEQPPKKRLQVLVQFSQPTISPSSSHSASLDTVDTVTTLPSELDLLSLHTALQGVDPRIELFADPGSRLTLPFPFLYSELPSERFHLHRRQAGCDFHYMGREDFLRVWDAVQQIGGPYGPKRIYIHGTIGYGKSHILAALACKLVCDGCRVIFLPDCRAMLRSPLAYLKAAFLCGYADRESYADRIAIRSCRSVQDLVKFSDRPLEHFYFIVDQMNAFDEELANKDDIRNEVKREIFTKLQVMMAPHRSITSASANYRTVMHMERKQTNDIKLSMLGGMSENEMWQWWKHHEGTMQIDLKGEDKHVIEDLTGCIPLLLRPLLTFTGQAFGGIEDLLHHDDIQAVTQNVHAFAREIQKTHSPSDFITSYISGLFACLAHENRFIDNDLVDHRYFYRGNDKVWYYTCGLVRAAAAAIIRKAQSQQFMSDQWLNSLDLCIGNPSVTGFVVEQACLSILSCQGLQHGDHRWGPPETIMFEGDVINSLPGSTPGLLLVPTTYNYKDIDALYFQAKPESQSALIVPIQITINKKHRPSSESFFAQWGKWQAHFSGYRLTTTFVWVVEDARPSQVFKEKTREMRTRLVEISPQYTEIFVTIKDLYPLLGFRLKAVREGSMATKRPHSMRLTLFDDEATEAGPSTSGDGGDQIGIEHSQASDLETAPVQKRRKIHKSPEKQSVSRSARTRSTK